MLTFCFFFLQYYFADRYILKKKRTINLSLPVSPIFYFTLNQTVFPCYYKLFINIIWISMQHSITYFTITHINTFWVALKCFKIIISSSYTTLCIKIFFTIQIYFLRIKTFVIIFLCQCLHVKPQPTNILKFLRGRLPWTLKEFFCVSSCVLLCMCVGVGVFFTYHHPIV